MKHYAAIVALILVLVAVVVLAGIPAGDYHDLGPGTHGSVTPATATPPVTRGLP